MRAIYACRTRLILCVVCQRLLIVNSYVQVRVYSQYMYFLLAIRRRLRRDKVVFVVVGDIDWTRTLLSFARSLSHAHTSASSTSTSRRLGPLCLPCHYCLQPSSRSCALGFSRCKRSAPGPTGAFRRTPSQRRPASNSWCTQPNSLACQAACSRAFLLDRSQRVTTPSRWQVRWSVSPAREAHALAGKPAHHSRAWL